MLIHTHSHPSVNEMDWQDDEVVSVYNGVRIPTGRIVRRRKLGDDPWGELDPVNTKLQLLLNKKLDLGTLDNEEITFGIPRCDDGKFSVKAAWQAANLPKLVQNKLQRELYKRANKKIQTGLLAAVDTIVELATSPYPEDKIRFEASKYLFERIMGKTPDVVVHAQEAPWEMVFSEIQRGPRPTKTERQAIEDGNTQDAEIVED
jgi:hypothetical protein